MVPPGGENLMALESRFCTAWWSCWGSMRATVLRVWRHPADPRLPGLAPSCDPETVLGWLTAAGIPAPEALHVELLGYRPLRRAVLRATADGADYYLKVLRSGYDDRLAERQELLAGAGVGLEVGVGHGNSLLGGRSPCGR